MLSRVSRLARHLDLARRAAFAEHGLETWEFDVLSALRRAGAPYALSPGRLVTQTLVTSGTMTNRIDRLEQRGLLARSPDPADRRGVVVSLTPAGQEHVDAAMADLLERERALLDQLDPAPGSSWPRPCARWSRRSTRPARLPQAGTKRPSTSTGTTVETSTADASSTSSPKSRSTSSCPEGVSAIGRSRSYAARAASASAAERRRAGRPPASGR